MGGHENFAISSETGRITIASALDYETYKSHQFLVRAFDGRYVTTATVKVTVININEVAPVFTATSASSGQVRVCAYFRLLIAGTITCAWNSSLLPARLSLFRHCGQASVPQCLLDAV